MNINKPVYGSFCEKYGRTMLDFLVYQMLYSPSAAIIRETSVNTFILIYLQQKTRCII